MKKNPLLPALRAELGGGEEMDFLAALPESAQARLRDDIHAARTHQRQSLDQAINHGMRQVPMLLRGPLKKILFP
jgi:hypothetical protein